MQSVNKQISTTLIGQALIPLLVEFVPTMLLVTSRMTGLNLGGVNAYVTGIYELHPVLNPLVTIFVVRAYRQQILAWFGGTCLRINDNEVTPMPALIPPVKAC